MKVLHSVKYWDAALFVIKEKYTEIIVGLAPGGVVALWVSGIHHKVQVGCWTADKLSADDELFASRGGKKNG